MARSDTSADLGAASEADLLDAEREWRSADPNPDGTGGKAPPATESFGIALSGGGIRSATFNLGLLQQLARFGLLERADYLSTVSGGGYIGGFWTAWRSREGALPGAVFPRAPAGGREPAEIRHLRRFSNFLSPRLGLFSRDSGRLAASLVTATLPALAAALVAVVLVLAAFLALAWYAAGPGGDAAGWVRPLAIVLPATLLVLGMELTWRRFDGAGSAASRGGRASSPAPWFSAGWVWRVVAVVSALGAWVLATVLPRGVTPWGPGDLVPFQSFAPSLPTFGALLWPAGVVVAVVVGLVALRVLVSTRLRRLQGPAVDRFIGQLLFVPVLWLGLVLLWAAGGILVHATPQLAQGGAAAITGVAAAAFAWARRLFGRQPSRSAGSPWTAILAPLLPRILAWVAVAGMIIVTSAFLLQAAGGGVLYSVVAGAAILLVVFLALLHPEQVGFHTFYRGRIRRAFLGASNPVEAMASRSAAAGGGERREEAEEDPASPTDEQADDDIRLNRLRPGRPVHLVCCAANDVASSDPLRTLHRGAVSAVLSPVGYSVGDEHRLWRGDAPFLGTALTASAAAFNPLMGARSTALGPAASFLMAALGLRLGVWLRRPSRWLDRQPRSWLGHLFYRELMGRGPVDSSWIHLSDGGHFENLAAYELIRRRCRHVIISDAGMDPDLAFDDFGNLVRKVRQDFRVEIRIDLSPLGRDAEGRARQPMVAGDIVYPDGDVGTLLYFKPSLTGNEPADIAQYAGRNSRFPHEATGDQFYDDAQWEAYRRLGEHAAAEALARLGTDLSLLTGKVDTARIFSRARRAWMPPPEGFVDGFAEVKRGAERLMEGVCGGNCPTLLAELRPELPELAAAFASPGLRPSRPASESVTPEDLPDEKELAATFRLVTDALLWMEDAFHRLDLERSYHHPLALGLTNTMAGWLRSPLLRMWWPLLRPLHTDSFARFLEGVHGLEAPGGGLDALRIDPALDRETGGGVVRLASAFAAPSSRPGSLHVGAWVELVHPAGPRVPVQVAVLDADEASDGAWIWDARGFHVPPGLWGTGIGTRFLHLVVDHVGSLEMESRVELPVPGDTDASRKAFADLVQLYRGLEFSMDPTIEGVRPLMRRPARPAEPG
ncbi:MAG: hypothetical protein EA350_01220 [Gemmatimonadales bacterium]|nr:MAG: hypothetical protein EA350_01220 [Gemmatimonadales bacterium]